MKTLMLALLLVGASVPFCPASGQICPPGQVLCSCRTLTGGLCSNCQSACLGLVRDCICKL